MSLVKWTFIGLIALPAAELLAFVMVASLIGWLRTAALFIATSVVGVLLLRKSGRADLARFRAAFAQQGLRAVHLETPGVATMIAGHGTPDQQPARMFAYGDPEAFAGLMDKLVDASAAYLVRQLQAGVDAVQIFDTWAGVLPAEEFARWCIGPAQRIVAKVRSHVPDAKVIGFPRGAGAGLLRYVEDVPVDAV